MAKYTDVVELLGNVETDFNYLIRSLTEHKRYIDSTSKKDKFDYNLKVGKFIYEVYELYEGVVECLLIKLYNIKINIGNSYHMALLKSSKGLMLNQRTLIDKNLLILSIQLLKVRNKFVRTTSLEFSTLDLEKSIDDSANLLKELNEIVKAIHEEREFILNYMNSDKTQVISTNPLTN